jgi:cytochrome P450
LSFDVMADTVFGMQYNLIEISRFRYVVNLIPKSSVRISILLHFASLKIFRLDKLLFLEAYKAQIRFSKFVMRLLFERMKLDNSGRTDFFSILTAATDSSTNTKLSQEEIYAESTTLIVAGAKSSAHFNILTFRL